MERRIVYEYDGALTANIWLLAAPNCRDQLPGGLVASRPAYGLFGMFGPSYAPNGLRWQKLCCCKQITFSGQLMGYAAKLSVVFQLLWLGCCLLCCVQKTP
jgi:hypothetical protein